MTIPVILTCTGCGESHTGLHLTDKGQLCSQCLRRSGWVESHLLDAMREALVQRAVLVTTLDSLQIRQAAATIARRKGITEDVIREVTENPAFNTLAFKRKRLAQWVAIFETAWYGRHREKP